MPKYDLISIIHDGRIIYLLTNYTQYWNKAHMYEAEIVLTYKIYMDEWHVQVWPLTRKTSFSIKKILSGSIA